MVSKKWECGGFTHWVGVSNFFTQSFACELHRVFQKFLHEISTQLAIDALLYFSDLVTEDEIEVEVLVDLLNTMHNSGVILDANFGGDFGGTEFEFSR